MDGVNFASDDEQNDAYYDNVANNRRNDNRNRNRALGRAVVALAGHRLNTRRQSQPMHNSTLTGSMRVEELLNGHEEIIQGMISMKAETFRSLSNLLASRGLLKTTRNMNVNEQLFIFLAICARGETNRHISYLFQHSVETTSRWFYKVLQVICSLKDEFIRPADYTSIQNLIMENSEKYRPWFDGIAELQGCSLGIQGYSLARPATLPHLASETARRLLTYSIDVRRELSLRICDARIRCVICQGYSLIYVMMCDMQSLRYDYDLCMSDITSLPVSYRPALGRVGLWFELEMDWLPQPLHSCAPGTNTYVKGPIIIVCVAGVIVVLAERKLTSYVYAVDGPHLVPCPPPDARAQVGGSVDVGGGGGGGGGGAARGDNSSGWRGCPSPASGGRPGRSSSGRGGSSSALVGKLLALGK
ncbi:hypothetical protein TIFTF001_024954 [Ficus carica]|uniref:DUF8040 domain-containing protein n=1 Tax=Ficus carica TaxID=3494 RepID=A0AA88DDS7_FICCA|nr:hypothetical protein TIFTF001_024954 [Ficus carica]